MKKNSSSGVRPSLKKTIPIKWIVLVFLPCVWILGVNSQSISEIKQDHINYIWGEGKGSTVHRADQAALSMLISQISVHVKSELEGTTSSVVENNTESLVKNFQSTVSTYSNATLSNAVRIVLSEEPNAQVFRYMRRDEIDKVFKERENKILGYVENAVYAEANAKIADALRYYYWSMILLKSHPNGNDIFYSDRDGNQKLLITWLPLQITNILTALDFKIIDAEADEGYLLYTLDITYFGEPVENLDYSFWDGMEWSNLISARDGLGYVELFGIATKSSNVRIKTEYIFEEEAHIDNKLMEVLSKIENIPFPDSEVRFPVPKNLRSSESAAPPVAETVIASTKPENIITSNKEPAVTEDREITSSEISSEQTISDIKKSVKSTLSSEDSQPTRETVNYTSFNSVDNEAPYRDNLEFILNSIKIRDYSAPIEVFTPEGYSIYEDIVAYGQAQLIGSPQLKFIKFEDKIICRSVPMRFAFRTNNKQFVENLVFYFNKDQKIENISFSLAENTLKEIVDKDVWSENERMILVNFLETYKTAYALKRINYLDQIFADDALIITGYVVKVAPNKSNDFQGKEVVKYRQQDKKEYIRNLRRSFSSKEYINIKFEQSKILKASKGGDIFGIQIKQNYYSSNYGDVGYLFLLIDFNNPDEPLIHVRTWEPEQGADQAIVGLDDFF